MFLAVGTAIRLLVNTFSGFLPMLQLIEDGEEDSIAYIHVNGKVENTKAEKNHLTETNCGTDKEKSQSYIQK